MLTSDYSVDAGIPRWTKEIAKRLARRHEVHIFARRLPRIDKPPIRFHCLPYPRTFPLLPQLCYTLAATLAVNPRKYDIVQGYFDTPGKDVLVAHHCQKALCSMKVLRGTLSVDDRLALILETYTYRHRRYKKIIAVSNKVRREIAENYKLPPDDITFIPGGVDLSRFHPNNKESLGRQIRAKYGIRGNEVLVLFVGSRLALRGAFELVKATSMLPSKAKLMVVSRENPGWLQRVASSPGLGKRVIITGFVPGQNIHAYYAAADIFAFPVFYGAFSLVVLEAMASGLPVVVSRCEGASEVISHRKDGFVLKDPGDTSQLYGLLSELVSDENLRKYIGKEARNTAEKYSWDKATSWVENIFEIASDSKA